LLDAGTGCHGLFDLLNQCAGFNVFDILLFQQYLEPSHLVFKFADAIFVTE